MIKPSGHYLIFPDRWYGDQFSPREEWRAEAEPANRDDRDDRGSERRDCPTHGGAA